MRTVQVKFIVLVMTMLCAACTTKPDAVGSTPKKVADQRLAAYTAIRRMSYRNACGSEGPLTICVDRITLSEGAALVDARVSNVSPERYLQGTAREGSVWLVDKNGKKLAVGNGETVGYPGDEEIAARFRLERYFKEEPHAVVLNRVRKRGSQPGVHDISITARLGE